MLAILSFLVLTQLNVCLSVLPYGVIFIIGKLFFHLSLQDWIDKLVHYTGHLLYLVMAIMEILIICTIVFISYGWYTFMEIPNTLCWVVLILLMEIFPFLYKCKKLKEYRHQEVIKEKIDNPIYK